MSNQSTTTPEAGARDAIDRYFQGHVTGDPGVMRKAFHPEARLQFVRDGAFGAVPLDEYLTWLPGEPAADEADRRRTVRHLHVADNVAAAEVVLDYPTVRFVDYLTIVRTGPEWAITNKSFQAYPKEGA